MQLGPQQPACDQIHAMKYRGEGETFREAQNRVASALADNDAHFHEFRDILLGQRFMPAGRVQAAMGAPKRVTPYNCFVSGTIHDSFVHGDETEGFNSSIMGRAAQAASTMRMGGGIGYDFSTLRPAKALIKGLLSQSRGPLSFMRIFNEVCLCTSSAGHRRGAQMGVLRIDHPDIVEFIRAKQNIDQLTGFNISVAVTDEFMRHLESGEPFPLRFGGETFGTVDAADLWEELMRSTWDWAEPGVLFIDRINQMNNLHYCETLAATNPCGEQPLPPFGACLLGSFNLVKYLVRVDQVSLLPVESVLLTGEGDYAFDLTAFQRDIPAVVRAMDNVVDRAIYPLPEQEAEAKAKRRMGLGVTGLANALEAVVGRPSYGDPEFLELMQDVMVTLRDETYRASALLAAEKGAFPLCDPAYGAGQFIQTLPQDIQDLIEDHGIRNSHLTSIAPTGTISFTADNISGSIEPVFEHVTQRPINTPDGVLVVDVPDYAFDRLGFSCRTTDEVTPAQHVAVLAMAQQYVDSAVSKTCNVPGDIAWDDFKGIYLDAWRRGAKGCTTFNKEGKRIALLTKSYKPKAEAAVESDALPEPAVEPAFAEGQTCQVDLATGRRSCE